MGHSHLNISGANSSGLSTATPGPALRSDSQEHSLSQSHAGFLRIAGNHVLLTEGFKTTAELKSRQACSVNQLRDAPDSRAPLREPLTNGCRDNLCMETCANKLSHKMAEEFRSKTKAKQISFGLVSKLFGQKGNPILENSSERC